MGESSADRSARELLLREFFALSAADQFEIFRVIREYLGAEIGKGTAVDEQIDRRTAAIAAIAAVSEHLGRTPWGRLTAAEFSMRPVRRSGSSGEPIG